MQLFCERAAAVRPDFVMAAANAADIAEICRRLDGIPLAIELAAAQVPHFSPRQIVDRLGDRLGARSPRVAASRRATGRSTATLDWSHALLGDEERAVFRRLAVFPGSFSPESALAMCRAAQGARTPCCSWSASP